MTSASINDIDPDIEISPVTVDVDVDHVHDHQPTKPHITPLPKIQLAVLLTLFLAEPITSTVIYPFINQLLNDFGITHGDPRKTGYYVGLLESIFFFAECLCILQWGRLSDRIGRKPVVLIGVSGLALSMIGFGLSKTFWALVISRAIAGALNGNQGVVKSLLGELTDDSNMAQAFSFLPICWAGGSTIGSFVGGVLSNPGVRFPRLFRSRFWKDYPYFLPCFATAMYSAFVFLLVVFLLKETLVRRSRRNTPDKRTTVPPLEQIQSTPGPETPLLSSANSTTKSSSSSSSSSSPPPSLFSVLTPRVQRTILNYSLLSLLDIAVVALQPLVFSTSVDAGGLGLPPETIGLALGAYGLLDGIVEVACFAWMCRKIGTGKLYAIGIASFVGVIIAFPVMNWMVRSQGLSFWVWVIMGIQFCLLILDGMAFACILMFVTASSPSRDSLGAVNGLAQTATSVMRMLGPASTTSFFAFCVEKNLLGGNLIYLVLILLTIVGFAAAQLLPDEPWPRGTNERDRT